jgi:hypothetical protein
MSKTGRNAHKPQHVTAQEALQMLQSAVGYLQMAGITVQAENQARGLTLTIPGACYVVNIDGTAAFHIGTLTMLDNGTGEAAHLVKPPT